MWQSAPDGAIVIAMQRAMLLALLMAAPAARSSDSGAPTSFADSTIVIHAATVLDGRGGTQHNAWVVVEGARIERVSTSPVNIAGARTIELGSATLLPGIIDAHVHPGWYVDRRGILTSITQLSSTRPTPDSLRAQVRQLKAQGADVIKLFASSGLGAGGAQTRIAVNACLSG
jgi:imidazolonepropionase-like amidohydrolase